MKVIEIVVSRSEKINTGNYESKDFFVSIKAEVEYDADIRTISAKLFAQCKGILTKQILLTKSGEITP